MPRLPHRSLFIIALALCAVASAAVAAPRARAQSYADVPASHWAHAVIEAVTKRGPSGQKVLDDYGELFKPEKAITRGLLARSLVLASGNYGQNVSVVAIKDVAKSHWAHAAIEAVTQRGP